MAESPRPISDLFVLLETLSGQPFENYAKLRHTSFHRNGYLIRFIHIQGSPGAFPASTCHLVLKLADLALKNCFLATDARKIATADYLLRAFADGVGAHARQNRGAQGSGSYQPLDLPPQVLERNLVRIGPSEVRIAFNISLPGSHDNRILARQALSMFDQELTGIVHTLKQSIVPNERLANHCDTVEDMVTLQNKLNQYGLVAFVGDGAVLPRQSGVSQAPLKKDAVSFHAPDSLAVEVDLPNAGRIRGLGIRPGVNVVIGGAYQGKSTLLDALCKGVFPHIPGDGRECVAVRSDAVFITAEQGRSVTGVDISGFIEKLPGKADTHAFHTNNASGSTSQAASIVETVQAGAGLLIIDEDSSATNFLIKDDMMRRLIPEDVMTPFLDRVQELYQRWGVSTLIVVGGSSEYLGVAHHVMAMKDYRPVDMTDRVHRLAMPKHREPNRPMHIKDQRRVMAHSFDPSFHSCRLGKTIPTRIKPLRMQEKVLEYGNQQLDLTSLGAIVDPAQVMAIGYALLLARIRFKDAALSPSGLAAALDEMIDKEGLELLVPDDGPPRMMARPRRLEMAAAINRIRSLQVETYLFNS